MQQAIAYKTWHPSAAEAAGGGGGGEGEVAATTTDFRGFLSNNVLVVLGRKGCCMATVAKRLLLGLGVNPATYEVEGETEEAEVVAELRRGREGDGAKGTDLQLPVVFIRGELFGGMDRVMETHITGELVPILKDARALWL
ncbi:hypothetical protein MLD38_030558 [Melastoma candidum]|uniref:Uncharacterized protein n=1 Tax=Melastoma candidum TaxID=119954 RepID=A0ACB9MLT0_9MYRT|nr:hypothetical protein MLD38_030558 [Melastoma candidum]